MVSITIDNKTVEVPEGTTVLRAAEIAGVHIPTLCDHPHLTPYGGCRLCLVEVEGARILQPSCTLPASNKMVVKTDTPKVKEARKFVLTMIFSERNHFCPYCQVSGGDCELQNSAYAEGLTHWAIQPNYTPFEVDASHPFFILENNRCILCRRCVRACGELIGNYTLGFEERGARSYLVADLGTPLGESTCVSCGTCVEVCPTGALIDRWSAYQGKETDVEHHKTICVGCSVGCGIDVLTRDNRLIRIEGNWDSPVNEGVLCKVARFHPMVEERQSITTPLIRKNGSLKAATWEEAIALVTEKVSEASKQKALSAFASSRLSVEALSLFKQIFADKLNASVVTSLDEGLTTKATIEFTKQNSKSTEGKLSGIHQSDCIVSFGADLISNHQVAGFFIKRLIAKNAKLITINTDDDAFSESASCSLKLLKGTYQDVVKGIYASMLKLGYISNSEKAAQSSTDLQKASSATSIPTEQFLKAAHILGTATKPFIVLGDEFVKNTTPDILKALSDLAKAANIITDTQKNVVSTKGAANSLAASLFGFNQPVKLDGKPIVYLAIGDDVLSEQFVKTVEKASFKIVQASYQSKLTASADVVLPVGNWLESGGTYISMDGTVQQAQPALVSSPDVKSNDKVLESVAASLKLSVSTDWKAIIDKQNSPVAIDA